MTEKLPRPRQVTMAAWMAVGASVLVVPKGSKKKDAAMKFLATATSAEGQAALATKTSAARCAHRVAR